MKKYVLALLALLLIVGLTAGQAGAQCVMTYQSPYTGPVDLNNEGVIERPADITIGTASGGINCLQENNVIVVDYNAPANFTGTGLSGSFSTVNYVQTQTDGGLGYTVSAATRSVGSPPVVEYEITITVNHTSNLSTTGITLRNLRFDVSTFSANSPLIASMSCGGSGAVPALCGPTASQLTVGYARPTMSGTVTALTQVGFANTSQTALVPQASFTLSTNPLWGSSTGIGGGTPPADGLGDSGGLNPFRVAVTSPVVGQDITTNPTDLVFNVAGVPVGVTVTFPSTITVSGLRFSLYSGGTISGVGTSPGTGIGTVIYNTTISSITAASINFTTVGCGTPLDSQIGVCIAPSPGPVGTGTATISAFIGPGDTSEYTAAYDTSGVAVPRYWQTKLDVIGSSSTCANVSDPVTTCNVPFFTIVAQRTVLLFPYVSTLDGYDFGMVVANTGSDDATFGINFGPFSGNNATNNSSPVAGELTFYFYPTNGAPFSWTPAIGNLGGSRGLVITGGKTVLAPGGIFAVEINNAIAAAGQAATYGPGGTVGYFDGYVIVKGAFDYGHGEGAWFAPDTVGTSVTLVPANVLGNANRTGYNGVSAGTYPEGLKQ